MIAVDTNLLVYAHRIDSPWHDAAHRAVRSLAEGRAPWAIPWAVLHEFLAVVTHPRIFRPPSTVAQAIDQAEAWLESPVLILLGEASEYWEQLRLLLDRGQVRGPMVHDARIAALCLQHGIRELWTADRDFSRFPEIHLHNPLVGESPPTPPKGRRRPARRRQG